MVYIYGGGFFSGSPTVLMYGPDFLLDKDVVLVVINYRVGPLGKKYVITIKTVYLLLKYEKKNIKEMESE